MSDLLATIKDGFETMEASQEVAFRAFYNAQKRQRQMNSPSVRVPFSYKILMQRFTNKGVNIKNESKYFISIKHYTKSKNDLSCTHAK